MKIRIPKESHKIIFPCFLLAFIYIILYELILMNYPSQTRFGYQIGIITSRISYSIVAASIFFLLSVYLPVYLPRKKKKRKILFEIYQKTLIIDTLIQHLKFDLGIEEHEFTNVQIFREKLSRKNPDMPVGAFANWHQYLYRLKTKLIDVVRSMSFYNEYLSEEFFDELLILERQLLSIYTFEGYKLIESNNLSYAEIDLQELMVHNRHIQQLRELEFKKYEKQFEADGAAYREKYYKTSEQ
jgi:hypothetical protein